MYIWNIISHRGIVMEFIKSDLGRLFFFILITAAEILLGLFLVLHGSESLKIFGVFLLILQVFALHKIYIYLSNFRQLV